MRTLIGKHKLTGLATINKSIGIINRISNCITTNCLLTLLQFNLSISFIL